MVITKSANMKKHLLYGLLFTWMMIGCQQEETSVTQHADTDGEVFTAVIEHDETRTYVEEGLMLRWTTGDQISLFDGNTLNRQYKFDGKTGDNSGTFSIVNAPYGSGNDLTANYAVYPYASGIKITERGVITASLPAEQHYAENSFGLGSNTMVAVTKDKDDTFLKFKNVCGYLKLQLYGDDVIVKSITLTGNDNETIAGTAIITPSYSDEPSVSMTEDATKVITLNCSEGVKIGTTAETSTPFWIVVPPTTFNQGFEVKITDINGNTFNKSTSKDISIERNIIKPMTAFAVEREKPAANEIWYTNGSTVDATDPNRSNEFGGAKIISNIYDSARGFWIITFDRKVTEIGWSAFENCSSLITVAIPDNVTSIKWAAFKNCNGLNDIIIPNGVTTIGYEAFKNCSSLTSLTIGKNVALIDADAFAYCGLRSVKIPDSVATIGDNAFYSCSSLTELIIGEGVNVIGGWAFERCSALSSVTIPDSVTEISNSAFAYCNNLVNVEIGNSVNSIGDLAFSYCSKLTEIKIPDSVISIGKYAFNECSNIENVSFGIRVSSIGESAFSECTRIQNITIPEHLEIIESNTFYKCTGLIRISIPTSVKTIRSAAFYGCANLTDVTIPDSVTEIGNSVFCGCTKLTNAIIPDGIKWIRDYTFARCSSLTEVTLGNNVIKIMGHAFESCVNLTSVIIPDSVTEIGAQAFYDCVNLETVYCKPVVPPVGGAYMFSYEDKDSYKPIACKIYVPNESVETYKQSDKWKDLNIVSE